MNHNLITQQADKLAKQKDREAYASLIQLLQRDLDQNGIEAD